MARPPNITPDSPPAPSKADESDDIAKKTADYVRRKGAIVTSPIVKHTVESLKATYPSLSKGNSPGRPKKDKK